MLRDRNSFEPQLPYWVFFSADSTDVVYSSIIVTLFGSVVQRSYTVTYYISTNARQDLEKLFNVTLIITEKLFSNVNISKFKTHLNSL